MKMNQDRMRELALVTVVSSFLLLMFPSGSMAAQYDWSIYHNWEYVPNGGYCSIIATDGVNHVEGTFEWVPGGNPGITFQYTYDAFITWYSAPATWSSPYYVFNFNTNWQHYYGLKFIIRPSTGLDYQCDLPETPDS